MPRFIDDPGTAEGNGGGLMNLSDSIPDPDTPDSGNGDPPVVDMGAYEFQFDPVDEVFLGDLDGDGTVGIVDFLALLANWGPCEPGCCLADLDIDGDVGITDFLLLLGKWG